MKSIVIYYSYTGNTKKAALEYAAQLGAEIIELKEVRRRSFFGVFFCGVPAAMSRKKAKIHPFPSDLSEYDKIIIAMPVWAGHPAPPMNNIIDILPEGKEVEVIMTSAGGDSSGSREKTTALIAAKGCRVTEYRDIKTQKEK